MGLRLNHISASHGGPSGAGGLLDGQARNALGLSGSMYFAPQDGRLATGPTASAANVVAGFLGHKDAAYIFSGTVGGNDKSVFLGDVTISGSLALGDGSSFADVGKSKLNGEGNQQAGHVGIFQDENTIRSSDMQFTEVGNLLSVGAMHGATPDLSSGSIHVGGGASTGQIKLHWRAGAGSDKFGTGDNKVGGLLMSGSGYKLGLSSSQGQVDIAGRQGVVVGMQGGGSSDTNILLTNAAQDLQIKMTDNNSTATNEKITLLNTNGSSEAAIFLDAQAGGVDINAAATKDFDVTAGQVKLNAANSNSGVAEAIALKTGAGSSDGGAADTIVLTNAKGTAAGAIALESTVGGVLIKGDKASAVAVHLDGNAAADSIVDIDAGILQIDSTGTTTVQSNGVATVKAGTPASGANLVLSGATVAVDGISGGAVNIATTAGAATVISIGQSVSETTVNDNLNVTGDAIVAGSLTVQGTQTVLDTVNLKVEDKVILLGSGSSSANSQGGIAIVSGSNTSGEALVFGRVDNDTWGFGRKNVLDGTVTTVADMTLTKARAATFEVEGTSNKIELDSSDLKISAASEIVLAPSANAVLPSADSADDLGSKDTLSDGSSSSIHSSVTSGQSIDMSASGNEVILLGDSISLSSGTSISGISGLPSTMNASDTSFAMASSSTSFAIGDIVGFTNSGGSDKIFYVVTSAFSPGDSTLFVKQLTNVSSPSQASTISSPSAMERFEGSLSGGYSGSDIGSADTFIKLIGSSATQFAVFKKLHAHSGNSIAIVVDPQPEVSTVATFSASSHTSSSNVGGSVVSGRYWRALFVDAIDLNGGSTGIVFDADGDTSIAPQGDDTLNFAAGGSTIAQLGTTGITMQNALPVFFRGSNNKVSSSGSGLLDLEAQTAVAFAINGGSEVFSVRSSEVRVSTTLLPDADNSRDLGSADKRFANIYTGDLNLRNDRGDWTLIEEEDFISFRNNATGRRFRMVMEDITGLGNYGPGNDGEM